MPKMTANRDAFSDLFPHGMLGSEELSVYLYPTIRDLPDYKPLDTINTLRGEIDKYVDSKGWGSINALFRKYKQESSEGSIESPVPIATISPRKPSPSKPTGLPEIILEPITTKGAPLPIVPTTISAPGKVIPFTIRHEPPKIVESKLGDLKTIKLSTPPVRMPGEKKGTLSHPPDIREGDQAIVIPTNPSSNIIPDKPFLKPTVTHQERIATFTNDQANAGVIIDDWSRVKNERGESAYTNKQLQGFAKAYGIQIAANTNKENLVRLLREYGMKNGLIK